MKKAWNHLRDGGHLVLYLNDYRGTDKIRSFRDDFV